MIPRRIAAQAVVGSWAITATAAFLLHWPCRNSDYLDDRFTSFCYTDLAPLFATADLGGRWEQLAPVPRYISQLVASLPVSWQLQLVVMQLLLAAAFLAVVAVAFQLRPHRRLDAALLALLPLWPLVLFVATDLLAVAALASALFLWRRRHPLAGVAAGIALAAGAWTWLLLPVAFVDAYRNLETRRFVGFAGFAGAVAVLLNLPRLFGGESLLIPLDLTAGEGSPLFIASLVTGQAAGTGLWLWLTGLAITATVLTWATRLEFDFRLEALLGLLIGIQLVTATSIEPQALTHLLWLLPLVWPHRARLLWLCLPLMVYVAAVWLRQEAALPEGRGLHYGVYAVIAGVLWVTLLYCIKLCRDVMVVQGIDVVAQFANPNHRHTRAPRALMPDA